MNEAAFATMRPGSLFINALLGELVDKAALADALDRSHLAGAALNVRRAPDQMPSAGLPRLQTVLGTPHIGGLIPPAADDQAPETVDQVAIILSGIVPDNSGSATPFYTLIRRCGDTS